MRVVVTAGPTREPIDSVRFISNFSTGKMGYALASAAKKRGHEVILISGPTGLVPPSVDKFISIETARDLAKAIEVHLSRADVLIMCAAVSDYRVEKKQTGKISKKNPQLTLRLIRNPDILKKISERPRHPRLVGFALETHNALVHARGKLKDKNLDIIVLNDLCDKGAGFAADTNKVTVIARDGACETWPLMSKDKVAQKLIRYIEKYLKILK